ncbi:MAG: glycosyltransferase [Clostridiales bacterium]|nr:glycosyltransferase [Clostridiales bacterium]
MFSLRVVTRRVVIKLKILHISNPIQIPTKGYGGTERVIHSLVKKQVEYGHEVSLLAGKPSTIPGVEDISFSNGGVYDERKFLLKRFFSGFSLKAFLKSRNSRYDIIHNHISEEALFFTILSKSPVLTTLHCPMSLEKTTTFASTALFSSLPMNTKFVSISKRSYYAYKPFYNKNLLSYIHNGVDVRNIPFNSKPNKQHDIVIGFVGKIIFEKNAHLAIKIADILHKMDYNIHLFIIGKINLPLSKYAKKLFLIAEKRNYVTIIPNASNGVIQEILSNCDVFINPSYEIGLMISQIEALAMGTPVVGFEKGCASEVVITGYNGYLGNSFSDIAKKCILALNINRKNCRKHVINCFNEKKMYFEYLKTYENLLK